MQIKRIKWRDSRMYITQCPKDEDWEVSEITSVGFVIYEDKNKIVLAGDLLDEDIRRAIVIPKENIIR
jgi:hypothetical protein